VIRHSMLWPAGLTSSCLRLSDSPAASRICSFTTSIPVTISVMACSTCIRVFISRKKKTILLGQEKLNRPIFEYPTDRAKPTAAFPISRRFRR